jgi:2-polyprenyl-3-methyl-5-hydroxy-6-metoxy-1,4-benzoquinol methylase
MSEQQKQTLNFFNTSVDEWQRRAVREEYSVIVDRHNAVNFAAKEHGTVKSLLDVGCGTGQLCIETSQMGINSVGLDFAPQMIERAKLNASETGSSAKFQIGSIFDVEMSSGSYDLVSAQGFIEYISSEQFDEFLEICCEVLTPGGFVAIGSRNRLFNLFTLNDFTAMEIELGFVDELRAEVEALVAAASQVEAIDRLNKFTAEYGHPVSHPLTHVGVQTRYQYSPAEILNRLDRVGLKAKYFLPVNFHFLPPVCLTSLESQQMRDMLAKWAMTMETNNYRLIPQCSSFVFVASK